MKLIKFLGITVFALMIFSCNNKKTAVTKASLKTEIDSVSYALGVDVATSIGTQFDVNDDLFMAGYMNVMDSTELLVNKDYAKTIIQMYAQSHRQEMMERQQALMAQEAAKQYGENKEAGETFLEENKTKEGVQVTESGLQYMVVEEGTGEKPSDEDQVSIHYTGTLIDGTKFDSSVDRGEPIQMGVSQFVPGFSEGLKLMPVGSKYKFFIPQELGYGANVQPGGPIEPFSALVFEVELLEIVQ
ncbi:FKBP-type peptidyl-prolyl cis-trans isomerase [Flavobacteriaceae bacterium XHP0103]|uniref:FKBP-type peptidyl-prolyl cis-trans isomerase n=1 Tax=Marixanthotalea marina TaxID=2844359 RepID=UPI002989A5FA|nr:FKBP-type peptidyl-prolyl cis-trans isomerase [Marixanthotalea marina]MBU3821805.1 FKBP-type peptidyl-prolyl cis-trans isomerase [Marixanthotalea marina]